MSQHDSVSNLSGQSPATSDLLASAFSAGLVLGGAHDDDDDVYFGDEEETEFTNGGLNNNHDAGSDALLNDSNDDDDDLLTGGGEGGGGSDSDDMFSKTYTSERSTFERHDSMRSAQSEAVKQLAEENNDGAIRPSFRAALLKKRQTRHNENIASASSSVNVSNGGGVATSPAGLAFTKLREQQQLNFHQQQQQQHNHTQRSGGTPGSSQSHDIGNYGGGTSGGLLGVVEGGGGHCNRVSSFSGASMSSNISCFAVAGHSVHSTPGSFQPASQFNNQHFPSKPTTMMMGRASGGGRDSASSPASVSPRHPEDETPLTLISTMDCCEGGSPRNFLLPTPDTLVGVAPNHSTSSSFPTCPTVGVNARVSVAATAGPDEDSDSDEEATMAEALSGPLTANSLNIVADLLRREGAPPVLLSATGGVCDMSVQDRHLNFRACLFEGEEYDSFYNHHQSSLRAEYISNHTSNQNSSSPSPLRGPPAIYNTSATATEATVSGSALVAGSPSPRVGGGDDGLFCGVEAMPGVTPLGGNVDEHHHRSSSQDNSTPGHELLLSTMQCPPTSLFPPGSTIIVGCSLKQLRRVQGPLHYTPLFASLFAVGGGNEPPRGTVVRHTGDYTLVRFRNIPAVNVAPITVHSHHQFSNSNNADNNVGVRLQRRPSTQLTSGLTQRGLWPHIDSSYHPLNTTLTPRQRSELFDKFDEGLDRTRSARPEDTMRPQPSSCRGSYNFTHPLDDLENESTSNAADSIGPPPPHPHHHNIACARLTDVQQRAFMEDWSTNRDERQRLRSEILRRSSSSSSAAISKGESISGGGAQDDVVTCEFTIHRSCLSRLA